MSDRGVQAHPLSATAALSMEGVSIWLDDLSRDRIVSGGLQRLIDERNVVGVTTNPTIFATALALGHGYEDHIAELRRAATGAREAAIDLTTTDVRFAADVLRPVHDSTGGLDGWVSIEVSADAAHDADATLAEARVLAAQVDRPNAFVKIPATVEGLEAITAATAEGIPINVTLIFSLARYRAVIDAYLTGLERAHAAGLDLGGIRSVASLFVSRVDTEVNARLERIGTESAQSLRGLAGIANARLAYAVFREEAAGERMTRLAALGANVQRPLWASTGVKDPGMPDTAYVTQLVAPEVVNTMPEATLAAVADHGVIEGDTITGREGESRAIFDKLAALGIDYDDVTAGLEADGVRKFVASGRDLLATVEAALNAPPGA